MDSVLPLTSQQDISYCLQQNGDELTIGIVHDFGTKVGEVWDAEE